MILTVEDVQECGILEQFNSMYLSSCGYDVRTSYFVTENSRKIYTLHPGSTVSVAAVETVNMPADLTAHLVLRRKWRNMGMRLTATRYLPGMHERIFFRVTNTSTKPISIQRKDGLVTLMFEPVREAVDAG